MAKKNIGKIFSSSISSSIQSVLQICGFIVFFTVLLEVLSSIGLFSLLSAISHFFGLPSEILSSIFAGFLEMTTGCLSASTSNLPFETILPLTNFIVSFSGLSIITQTTAIASSANIPFKGFLVFKLIQGLLTTALTALAIYLFPISSNALSMLSHPIPGESISILFLIDTLIFFLLLALYDFSNKKKLSRL